VTTARPLLRRRLITGFGAGLALVLVAYLFYYLDSLPQSVQVKADQPWTAGPGQALRLNGYAPGPLLTFEIADPTIVKLSFDAGAKLWPDADSPNLPAANGQPLLFDMVNVERENASISISAQRGAVSTLVMEPVQPDRAYMTLRIHVEGAPVDVTFQTFPSPSARQHGHLQLGSNSILEQAKVTIPPGVAFTLGLSTKLNNLRVDPGIADKNGTPQLALRGLEIGDIADEAFERRWAACGAPPGKVLWVRPIPRFSPADCRPDRLSVNAFRIEKGVTVGLAGSGFVVRDGTTETWPGFREIIDNQLVQTAMGVLLAGLVSWAFLAIRGRKAGSKRKR